MCLFSGYNISKSKERSDIVAKRNAALAEAMGKRISTKRKSLGLTQEQAAERAGLSQQFYACIERGIKSIGADSLLKISTSLGVSADYLLTGAMEKADRIYITKMMEVMTEEQRTAAEEIIRNLLLACGYDVPER